MLYKMPRVVHDQRAVFESNELFRRLSNETETKYVGYMNSSIDERRSRFQSSCQNGRAEIAFVNCGLNLYLQCYPWNADSTQSMQPSKEYVNFEREPGKVYLRAPLILNGVCVCYKGWINTNRLDGMGHIEFDEERAQIEASQQSSVNASSQHLGKIPLQKTLKHPSSSGNPIDMDKRPRLR